MFILKRKLHEYLVLGTQAVVAVKEVSRLESDKSPIVSLGIDVPRNMKVYRGEKYLESFQQPQQREFPYFFRLTSRMSGQIYGYKLTLPGEVCTRMDSLEYTQVGGVEDLRQDDHELSIYLYPSYAEAEAFINGLMLLGSDMGGYQMEERNGEIIVLVDHYDHPCNETYTPANLTIRDFCRPSENVLHVLGYNTGGGR